MSSILPPLANVIAMYSRDPERLAKFAACVEADATLKVFRPAAGWIAAFHTLPLSIPDSDEVLSQGYVFAEGREAVSTRTDPIPGLKQLGETLDKPDPRQLAQIPGDYTFFRFKPDGSVTAVRSCGGLVPVYIWESNNSLVLSTHATWLAKYAGWRGEPDWLITAMWLSGWPIFAQNRSHLEGVKILHKGERYDWTPAEAHSRIARYWYPPQANDLRWPTKKIEREHQEEFRNILIGSLRDNLDPDGGNLLSLSGGVDSASLLALTAGHLNYGVQTFSLTPPKNARFYEREMGYLSALWDQYKAEHREIESLSEAEFDLIHGLPPILFPGFNPTTLALVGPMRDTRVRVIFGGEFADEVVGSSSFTLPDWARHVPVWRLPFLLKRLPGSRRQLPLHMIEQQITCRLFGHVSAPFPNKLADWMSAELELQRANFKKAVESEWTKRNVWGYANPTLWLRSIYMDFQPMQWEICSWVDVRRFSPFCIRPIQELAFRCHPVELLGRHSKHLLRNALKGLIPSKFLERSDKGYFGALQWETTRTDVSLMAIRAAGWQPLLGPDAGHSGEWVNDYLLNLAGCYASRYVDVLRADQWASTGPVI